MAADLGGKLSAPMLKAVNKLGEEGWELVAVDKGLFWFKRKKK